jgi:hypothetical protein
MARAPLKLYWAWTEDHDEDWFIVASSARQARSTHEGLEGYATGDASVRLVCRLPPACQDAEIGWPSDEVVRACGGVFLRDEQPRVVKIGDETFAEGILDAKIVQIYDDMFEARGQPRLNGTKRRTND